MTWGNPTGSGGDAWEVQQGWDVIDVNGDKVGDISDVEQDYLVVSKGFLFQTERYIPAMAIDRIEQDRVYLNVSKDEIDARGWDQRPSMGTDMGSTAGTTTDYGTTDVTAAEAGTTHVPIVEEELDIRTRETEQGRVRIHKDVVEEEQSVDVPVREEEVQVERHRVDDRAGARDVPADAFQERDIEIPVRGEEVDVSKEATVREHVDISKTARERTERVSDTVRREEVDVEGADDVPGTGRGRRASRRRGEGDVTDEATRRDSEGREAPPA